MEDGHIERILDRHRRAGELMLEPSGLFSERRGALLESLSRWFARCRNIWAFAVPNKLTREVSKKRDPSQLR
jgi:hypothetical protein